MVNLLHTDLDRAPVKPTIDDVHEQALEAADYMLNCPGITGQGKGQLLKEKYPQLARALREYTEDRMAQLDASFEGVAVVTPIRDLAHVINDIANPLGYAQGMSLKKNLKAAAAVYKENVEQQLEVAAQLIAPVKISGTASDIPKWRKGDLGDLPPSFRR